MIERLDDAFQHINRFSADASHELRTPLTILQLELEELAQSYGDDAAAANQIGSALEETQRMSHIVESSKPCTWTNFGTFLSSTLSDEQLFADQFVSGISNSTDIHLVGHGLAS